MQALRFWTNAKRAVQRLRCLVIVPLVLAADGCKSNLSFERETVVAAFPPGRDEIRALVVYEGFLGSDKKDAKLDGAKRELEELMVSEQKFFLWGWPFILSPAPHADNDAEKKYNDFLRNHLTIRKGGFFSDRNGRVNGYQYLTVRDVQKLVAGINDEISTSLAKSLPETLSKPKEPDDPFDKESLELILKAAREKHQWVALTPGRFSFTLPGTQALFERGKRGALEFWKLEDLLKEAAKAEEAGGQIAPSAVRESLESGKRHVEWLSELPLSFDLRKDRITASLGFGDGEPIIVRMPYRPQKQRRFAKELIAHARTLKVPFREKITSDSVIAEFLKEVGGPAGKHR